MNFYKESLTISESLGLSPIEIDLCDNSEYIYTEYEFTFIPWNKGLEYKSESRDNAARKNFQNYSASIKDKSYEDIYGKEKAEILKKARREFATNRIAPSGWKVKDTSKYSKAANERWSDEEYRKRNCYKWVSNLQTREIKKIHHSELEDYLSIGWIRGRKRKELGL